MASKFARNFCLLIFLPTIIVNSFCVEPTKRFGCHNLSSVDKIADMNGRNEIFRNLIQCMRDTRTYNEKNLETAKKLQNDFESAAKPTPDDDFGAKLFCAVKFGVTTLFAVSCFKTLLQLLELDKSKTWESAEKVGEWAGADLLAFLVMKMSKHIEDSHASRMNTSERERKKVIATYIENFVNTLQKKK